MGTNKNPTTGTSKNDYKRKFRVEGSTVRTCDSEGKKCQKQYGERKRDYSNVPCCGGVIQNKWGSLQYTKDTNKCPFGVGKPLEYVVSEMEDGTWKCSCPVWVFQRKECSHIRKAKMDPERYEIAKEFTGRTLNTMDNVFGNLGDN